MTSTTPSGQESLDNHPANVRHDPHARRRRPASRNPSGKGLRGSGLADPSVPLDPSAIITGTGPVFGTSRGTASDWRKDAKLGRPDRCYQVRVPGLVGWRHRADGEGRETFPAPDSKRDGECYRATPARSRRRCTYENSAKASKKSCLHSSDPRRVVCARGLR